MKHVDNNFYVSIKVLLIQLLIFESFNFFPRWIKSALGIHRVPYEFLNRKINRSKRNQLLKKCDLTRIASFSTYRPAAYAESETSFKIFENLVMVLDSFLILLNAAKNWKWMVVNWESWRGKKYQKNNLWLGWSFWVGFGNNWVGFWTWFRSC